MDPKKIGNLIYELRTKNHLTQKQLADKLLVTSQAISKWENGRGIPDIEMLQKLSEIFSVDISELLAGNVKNVKSTQKNNKVILTSIIIGCILLIIISLIAIKIFSENDFKISKLASDNDAFHIKGIIAYSNNKKSIYISEVDYNDEDRKEYLNLECVLYEVDGKVENRISECSSASNLDSSGEMFTLSELLKDIELNVDDYSCSCNMPVCNKLYLKINAINKDKETITYNVPIELESSCDENN